MVSNVCVCSRTDANSRTRRLVMEVAEAAFNKFIIGYDMPKKRAPKTQT